MINRKLVWYLDSHNLFTCNVGSDPDVARLDLNRFAGKLSSIISTQFRCSLIWRKLMKPQGSMGLWRSSMYSACEGTFPFLLHFLKKDSSFKVRVGSIFSDSHLQEMGVPHGSILIVTLFSVKINSIAHCLNLVLIARLYVGDFQICYRSSNISIIERQLQLCLNKVQQWATDIGFRFSKTKTLCMHICQKRGLHLDPQLFLDKSPIPVVEETNISRGYLSPKIILYSPSQIC